MKLLIYIFVTIILAYIDKLRIDDEMKKKYPKKNISHRLSDILAILGAIPLYIFIQPNFKILYGLVFILGCIGVRELFYDPMLNIFRKLRIDYGSPTSTSTVDIQERKWGLTFWEERLLGGIILVLSFVINTFVLSTIK